MRGWLCGCMSVWVILCSTCLGLPKRAGGESIGSPPCAPLPAFRGTYNTRAIRGTFAADAVTPARMLRMS